MPVASTYTSAVQSLAFLNKSPMIKGFLGKPSCLIENHVFEAHVVFSLSYLVLAQ